jgi:16S rRNA (guanine966-N2)-methyltransferase
MRIIAGKFKSRILVAPKNIRTRPTTDRARESLFNVLRLQLELEGASVLDLFAGSGALGFEALSRGAARATFIENDRAALEALETNRTQLATETISKVIRGNVYKRLSTLSGPFDLILADAPYDDTDARTKLPTMIAGPELLADEGLLVIEHRSTDTIALPESFEQVRILKAGEATFTILRKNKTATEGF